LIFGLNGVDHVRAIGPVIESLAKEYDGKINVGKVNVDVNPHISMNYGITSIPAILFFKNGTGG
jgi:thioredoxin 1